ncbi:MAG TPA: hypothetical protein P5138_09200 [Solirubrobacterales bacterium]|nr:hypothetical protein [Solirubrobacterales bacterium]
MSDTTITLPEITDEFAGYPVGVEENPSGGWLVMNGDTWWGIAVRNYLPAAQAIARQANGMDPKPGDAYLLSLEPVGNEYGPNREGACVVM